MCGIVGYIGEKDAYPILIKGLKRLEYRGYDSAGIALVDGRLKIYKKKGKVSDLEKFVEGEDVSGSIGIAHTRWATHGEPSDANAHPHTSMKGKFVIIHNGIIENYSRLKKRLEDRGYKFRTDTDTEVLANLIEYIYLKAREGNRKINVAEAVMLAMRKVIGTYGVLVLSEDDPDQIIAARNGSPLVIGIGKNEYFFASDATPIVEYTKSVIYMNDGDFAIVSKKGGFSLKTISNEPVNPAVEKLDIDIAAIEKGGYDHFMLKEIFEQPQAINDTFRGRLSSALDNIVLGGLHSVMDKLVNAKRIIIVGCGTSWHAGLVGEYLIEEYARIPVEVEYGSEFRYRNPILTDEDIVIAISQSGETADTLAAVRLAKERGATVLGICNVVGSSIPRETDAGVYTHAGPEIGVASTKAFTSQVTVLTMLAYLLGYKKGVISQNNFKILLKELNFIPNKITEVLKVNDYILDVARKFIETTNFLYLGRGVLFPVALEGALKLKEISYIHAEGYPAAEMKHGPIALIDENMPVVVIATKDKSYEKIVSNIQEIKARNGIVIAVVTKGDETISSMADYKIEVEEVHESLAPLLTVVPLQLLAYHVAVLRGCNVDQPRNLAKSVTVE